MVIGLDVREALDRPAGKGRYAFEMLSRLPELASDEETFRMYAASLPDHTPPAHTSWDAVPARGIGWHRAVARRANRECDVYFSPTSYLTPQFLRIPSVITVHDLIAFNPDAHPQRRAQVIERLTLGRAVRKAAAIIAVSESTARDLAERYPGAADKVTVVHSAADERFQPYTPKQTAATLAKHNLPRRFILAAGTLEPRKNLERLVRAYHFLPEKLRSAYPLILVGKKGWRYQPVFDAIQELRLGTEVRHLDYVSDEDLAKLYAAATVFCYPSLYEGFGLPVLEAMQAGTPVITSKTSSLPEIGGRAVRYADPRKTTDISKALKELLQSADERTRLRNAGRERAAKFSWKQSAGQTMEVLRQAAASGSRRVS